MPPPARSPASGPRRRFLLLPLLLLPLLLLLHLISSPLPRPLPAPRKPAQACDYSAGEWVRDASAGPAPRYDHTCKEIFKGWNCIANGKGNGRDLLRWRWRPSGARCELPRLDPRRFLERHRDSSIGQAAAPVISPKKGAGRSSPVPLSPRRRRPRSTHLAGEGSFGVGHGRVASANPAPARRRDAGEEDEGDGGSSAGAAAPDSTAPQRRAALRRDAGGAMAAGETQAGHSSSTPKVRDERQREGSMREGDDDDSAQYGARRLGIGEGCGFVGDSLNRNMFVSLVCMLRGVSGEVRKWRPAGADRGFTFLRYNLTVAYHRTNLLVRYGRWSASPNGGPLESLGYKQGYRVDVDIPDQTWVEACSFHDVLIFNTGHWWWAPSKFDPMQSPMLFFEKGKPVVPPLLPSAGLDLALQHMITFVNKAMRPNALKFFRTQSPRHFEGGDWNEGGSCQRNQPLSAEEVEEFFSLDYNGTNIEARLVNKHLMKALEQSTFRVLDITHMSELRADAHPSTTGGKKHDDCMHWCLPGLTDTWNDLLAVNLEGVDS